MMSKLSVVASILVVSCAPETRAPNREADPGPVREDIEQRHRTPVLGGAPIWAVEGPTPEGGECFGVAVAVGDFDGDGYRDVVVGQGSCGFGQVSQGRIAIYRGGPSLPSTTPVWTDLDWQNPPRGGTHLGLEVGDVDGDHHDDLLVRSAAGVQVFAGITNLDAPLGPPTFRVPGTDPFLGALLADVNGDHRADIISVERDGAFGATGTATVWLSTPGQSAPFIAARVIAPANQAIAAGDTNHDGKADVIVNSFGDPVISQLLLGCRAHERGCDGGLRSTPAWTTTDKPAVGTVPDLNHDGLAETIVTDTALGDIAGFGRIWLYLSDRKTGGLSATPAWSMISDPNYGGFGGTIVVPGDLDGDHHSTEFVSPSDGRIYAFFPRLDTLASMKPGFAWPRHDSVQEQIDSGELVLGLTPVVAAAGDVNRDRFDDLVVGDPPLFLETRHGHAYLFSGGRRPAHDDPPPFLPGAPVCQLPATGKPDLTVDTPALARSLFVDNVEFAPDACELSEACIGGPGLRRLIRFTTSLQNLGGAPAIVPGPDTAPELYHFNECEGEFELDGFAIYELIDSTGTTIATGRKQSIFPEDTSPTCIGNGGANLYFPDSGITPGWADVYVAFIPCQWLDATDVPDGRYTLRITVDVNHLVDQDDVLPDTVSVDLELSGNSLTVLH